MESVETPARPESVVEHTVIEEKEEVMGYVKSYHCCEKMLCLAQCLHFIHIFRLKMSNVY